MFKFQNSMPGLLPRNRGKVWLLYILFLADSKIVKCDFMSIFVTEFGFERSSFYHLCNHHFCHRPNIKCDFNLNTEVK